MAYCVMNLQKQKRQAIPGLQKEANREMAADKYKNCVDLEKTDRNIYLVKSSDWLQDINRIIKNAGIKKVRKDAVLAVTGLYTASPDWFAEHSEDMISYFKDCLKFHQKNYGTVINAVIHLDETTPHLQVCSVPITSDNRLSAKDLVGNKGKMHDQQTRFYEECGKNRGLLRGEERSAEARKKHLDEQSFVIKKNQDAIKETDLQLQILKQDKQKLEEKNLQIAGESADLSDRQDNALQRMQLFDQELQLLEREKEKLQNQITEINEAVAVMRHEASFRYAEDLKRQIWSLEDQIKNLKAENTSLVTWMKEHKIKGKSVLQYYEHDQEQEINHQLTN